MTRLRYHYNHKVWTVVIHVAINAMQLHNSTPRTAPLATEGNFDCFLDTSARSALLRTLHPLVGDHEIPAGHFT